MKLSRLQANLLFYDPEIKSRSLIIELDLDIKVALMLLKYVGHPCQGDMKLLRLQATALSLKADGDDFNQHNRGDGWITGPQIILGTQVKQSHTTLPNPPCYN